MTSQALAKIQRQVLQTIIALNIFLHISCVNGVSVSVRPDSSGYELRRELNSTKFNCNSLMTIVAPKNDRLMLQPLLETEFVGQGFEVVSEAVARSSIEIDRRRDENGSTTSIYKSNKVKSAYIFRFRYLTRDDFPNGEVVKTFAGNVVDLRSGRIAATVTYSQGVMGSTSIEDMTKEIVTEVLAKIPCI